MTTVASAVEGSDFSRRHVSIPSRRGMSMSRKMIEGRTSWARSMASSPSAASHIR